MPPVTPRRTGVMELEHGLVPSLPPGHSVSRAPCRSPAWFAFEDHADNLVILRSELRGFGAGVSGFNCAHAVAETSPT
jgi:hypothetical protein